MDSLGLMFVGSVLLINGLGLLGVVPPKSAAPINAFVGVLLIAVVLSEVLPALGGGVDALDTVLGAAGYLLFAFTYLYVALGNWSSADGSGLGWYCGWAVLVSLFLSAVSFARSDDPAFGSIWLSWAVLFAAFFLVLARSMTWLSGPAGYLTMMQAFTTTTVPGALLLLGWWDDIPIALVAAVQLAVVLIFLLAARAARRGQAPTAGAPTAAGERPLVATGPQR